MKEYLKVIIVLVSFVSLVLIVLPEGRMIKTACICFSFVICLTLLSPLKNYVGDFVINDQEQEYDISQEQDYKSNIYKYIIKKILAEEKIELDDVTVEFSDENKKIKKVGIKLNNSVLKEETEHINIIVKAKKSLSNRLNISDLEVYVYE